MNPIAPELREMLRKALQEIAWCESKVKGHQEKIDALRLRLATHEERAAALVETLRLLGETLEASEQERSDVAWSGCQAAEDKAALEPEPEIPF